ncbi:type VII toxin-antitoxin system HepT family RNase toxin [Pseudalkalibacillus sp. A8]|uniref:type VII toxin-antitoxin system HepT family RNase toxin n=1 Tax=Pseudalkalibacillus sp. A8 TaxID=3382641 RepID=UPI0038B47DB1
MYFVDRKKIEELLRFMNHRLDAFESEEFGEKMNDQLFLERIGHMVIETIIDVGNKMIDGFIMRDPGSYEDIIDILEDEKVVSSEDAESLKQVISLRKMLVQNYTEVDHKEVEHVLRANLEPLKNFPSQVRRYLTEELGPVSAFLPDDHL